MNTKVIITGPHTMDKLSIAKQIVADNDNLSIAPTFTTDMEYKDIAPDNDEYIYYMGVESVELTMKNNFTLFMSTHNYITKGITIDNFYNNDIFCMELEDFNNISDHMLQQYDLIVIWVDAPIKNGTDSLTYVDICETKYLEERLETLPYLYFFNSDKEEISSILNAYLFADDNEKQHILDENN